MLRYPSALAYIALFSLVIAPTICVTRAQTSPQKPKSSPIILGVLEDIPGVYVGDHDTRKVRAVFQKVGDTWQAFPTKTKGYLDLKSLPAQYPKEVQWTIAFHGKALGTVTAHAPTQFDFYSWIGTEIITSHGPVPTVGKKSAGNSGYLGDPVYRPLVAVSQPNVADPDHWHRAQPTLQQIAAAKQQFRVRFPSISNCKNPYENIRRRWHYRNSDIHIRESYSSKSHWTLIHLSLNGYACDGPQDPPFLDQWFVIQPSGKVRFQGQEMWLVDAGDYDNDGMSELLFSIDGDNEGGYRLYYDNFTRCVQFSYHYH